MNLTLRQHAAAFALLTLAPSLHADEVIDSGPSATLGTAGSHTLSGAGTTYTVIAGADLNADTGLADLIVGNTGSGSLFLSDGATMEITSGSTDLGFAAGSSGSLTISSGASLSTNWLGIGYHPTASGTILVTGAGSSLSTASGFDLGFAGGTSNVTVTAGASLTNSDSGLLERGTLTVSAGGTLDTGATGLDPVFDITTANLASYFETAGLTPLTAASATVTITGTGSSWVNRGAIILSSGQTADTVSLTVTDHATLTTDKLRVGIDNAGPTFTVSGGADVTVANANIADYGALDTIGDVLVTGTGTTLALSSADSAGYYATLFVQTAGSFTATGGATVTVNGDSILADGDLSLSGAGTTLTHTASVGGAQFSGALAISDGATFTTNRTVDLLGATTISGGGTFISTRASSTSTSVNRIQDTATVTGAGSSLTFDKILYVGGTRIGLETPSAGQGTLTIAAGATVTTTAGSAVGYATSASSTTVNYAGHAVVTGSGSTWNNTGNFVLGQYRHADLTISTGGILNTTGNTIIGGTGSSINQQTASATVTGAGSQLNTTGTLYVGLGTFATGNLTLADHGLATAASTLVNDGDTLALGSFGTLDTAALTVASGGTVLAHDNAVFAFDLGAPSLIASHLFEAGSILTADSGATVYLLLNAASGFGAGTYSLLSFDPSATLGGITAATFQVATDFGGYGYSISLTATQLTLSVTEMPGAAAYEVAGLTSPIPEPSSFAALAGLATLALAASRRRRA